MRLWLFGLVAFSWLAILVNQTSAGVPTEQLTGTVDEVLRIVSSPEFSNGKKKVERRKLLKKAVAPLFDFTEMSRRALGQHWRELGAEEKMEFTDLFASLLEHAYAGTIDSYSYAGEKVLYIDERVEDSYAEVDTKIVRGPDRYAISYRMLKTDDQWKVYDVAVEGVSLVNNYRSQFNKILANKSMSDLMKKLREKQRELQSQ